MGTPRSIHELGCLSSWVGLSVFLGPLLFPSLLFPDQVHDDGVGGDRGRGHVLMCVWEGACYPLFALLCFVLKHLALFRAYSWLGARESLLVVLSILGPEAWAEIPS